MKTKPTVVCLCGSTRFMQEFYDANMRETLAGKIVLSVGMSSKGDCRPTEEQKIALDVLHKQKIDLADEILVLDVVQRICPACKTRWIHDSYRIEKCSCGAEIGDVEPKPYIGDSTRSEIAYAEKLGKKVRYLSKKE